MIKETNKILDRIDQFTCQAIKARGVFAPSSS